MSAKKNDKSEAIREKIKTFPTGPGLYFMKGPKDKVLYIGKAKNLRSRVSSYFQQAGDLAVSITGQTRNLAGSLVFPGGFSYHGR